MINGIIRGLPKLPIMIDLCNSTATGRLISFTEGALLGCYNQNPDIRRKIVGAQASVPWWWMVKKIVLNFAQHITISIFFIIHNPSVLKIAIYSSFKQRSAWAASHQNVHCNTDYDLWQITYSLTTGIPIPNSGNYRDLVNDHVR